MTEKERKHLFQQGLAAGRRRDYAEAVNHFAQLADGDDPKSLLLLARSYHGLGNFGRAIQLFQTYLGLHGSTPEVCFFVGRSWLAAGMPSRAVIWLEKAYQGTYSVPQTLGLLGIALLKSKNPMRSVEVLSKAVELAPQHRGIYIAYLNSLYVRSLQLFHVGETDLARQMLQFLVSSGAESTGIEIYLAVCLRELGRYSEAVSHFEAALEASPDDPVLASQLIEALHCSGRKNEAQVVAQRYKNILPQGVTAVSSEMVEAMLPFQYLQQGKLRQAIYFALKGLKKNPNFGQLSLVVGEAYRQLGQMQKAQAHFERARRGETVAEAESGLLLVHWQAGRFDQALAVTERQLRIQPKDPNLLYYQVILRCKVSQGNPKNLEALRTMIPNRDPDPFLFAALAGEYHHQGLEDLALPWLRRALTLDPENKSAIETLGAILPKLAVADWKMAFTQYLQLRPQDAEILRIYIRRLMELKDWQEAQNRLLDWMALGHRNIGSLRALGYIYRMQEHFADAFLIYRELLHADPKNPEYLSGVILCLYKNHRKDFALEFAQKALKVLGPDIRFYYQLGVIALLCDDRDQAERSFRKALEINPHHGPSYLKMAELFEQAGDTENAERYRKHGLALKTPR